MYVSSNLVSQEIIKWQLQITTFLIWLTSQNISIRYFSFTYSLNLFYIKYLLMVNLRVRDKLVTLKIKILAIAAAINIIHFTERLNLTNANY